MGNEDNRRMKTPCGCCMSVFKWIPVLFIFAVIGWSYYAYVVELCVLKTENRVAMAFMLLFYHIALVLFLWSYWQTISTSVGRVPDQWRIPDEEVNQLFRADNQETQKRILNNFARNLPVTNRTINGSVRFCEKCKIVKPDRSHHCSVCSCCVLKMDHHCPWVNNCVNFSNYKFFVLFLGYALIYCLYVALTTLHDFIQFVKNENGLGVLEQGQPTGNGMGRFHILFLFFISIMFAISLVSLFGYHIYLVLVNRTTLEAFRAPIFRVGGPDKNGYNLGRYANFCEVFGDKWELWFLPVFTSKGDGLSYRTSSDQTGPGQRYEAMGNTTANPASNRLDVQATDKLIDAIPLNNHQPHLELDNGQSSSHNHPLIPPSQVVVNIEQTAAAGAAGGASTTAGHATNHVVDMIGDQVITAPAPAAKDVNVPNGGPPAIPAHNVV